MNRAIAHLIIIFIAITSLPMVSHAAKKAAPSKSAVISQVAIDALADNDLNNAAIALLYEQLNDKARFLLRETTRIVRFDMSDEKPPRDEAHSIYQNVAIAYHNLYLFLLSKKIDNTVFYKKALKYYKKAKRSGTPLHRAECDVLTASIIASSGNIKKAEKKFSRVDQGMLRWDFASSEYLATYHAAIGDVDMAIEQIDAAYRINPSLTKAWISITDDFNTIMNDPKFIGMIASWATSSGGKKAFTLTLPESKPLTLDPIGSPNYLKVESLEPPKVLKRRRRRRR
jgi:tetratricopeptide (TPR) repeat protein